MNGNQRRFVNELFRDPERLDSTISNQEAQSKLLVVDAPSMSESEIAGLVSGAQQLIRSERLDLDEEPESESGNIRVQPVRAPRAGLGRNMAFGALGMFVGASVAFVISGIPASAPPDLDGIQMSRTELELVRGYRIATRQIEQLPSGRNTRAAELARRLVGEGPRGVDAFDSRPPLSEH